MLVARNPCKDCNLETSSRRWTFDFTVTTRWLKQVLLLWLLLWGSLCFSPRAVTW